MDMDFEQNWPQMLLVIFIGTVGIAAVTGGLLLLLLHATRRFVLKSLYIPFWLNPGWYAASWFLFWGVGIATEQIAFALQGNPRRALIIERAGAARAQEAAARYDATQMDNYILCGVFVMVPVLWILIGTIDNIYKERKKEKEEIDHGVDS